MSGAPEAENVRAKVAADVRTWARAWDRAPGPALVLRLLLLEPGFQLAFALRLQELAGRVPAAGVLLRRLVWLHVSRRFGCDIDPQARIGGGVRFPHPYGVVIGGGCTVGRDVVILQHVTLGRLRGGQPSGPAIGDGALLNAGAVLIGDFAVGAGAVVGANAVVLAEVPAGWSAVGVPARNLAPRSVRDAAGA